MATQFDYYRVSGLSMLFMGHYVPQHCGRQIDDSSSFKTDTTSAKCNTTTSAIT